MVTAPTISTSDPVLASYRATLAEVYGDRLDSVVLFGSRARGDARPDSDYDIAVFLKDITDRWAELDRLANLGVRFQDDTGALIDAKPYPLTAYRDDSPLMWEIRRDGLSL
jgi:predicted nucleotidyltransferase